jgi:hypothetical protein
MARCVDVVVENTKGSRHRFAYDKTGDPEPWSETMGRAGRDEAWAEIDACIRRRQELAGAGARR